MTQIKLRRHCSGVAIKQFSGDNSLNANYLTTSLNGLCSKESAHETAAVVHRHRTSVLGFSGEVL